MLSGIEVLKFFVSDHLNDDFLRKLKSILSILIFLIVYYLIDLDLILLYRKKNFEILTNFTPMPFSQYCEIL